MTSGRTGPRHDGRRTSPLSEPLGKFNRTLARLTDEMIEGYESREHERLRKASEEFVRLLERHHGEQNAI
jgi:hypothetical protein